LGERDLGRGVQVVVGDVRVRVVQAVLEFDLIPIRNWSRSKGAFVQSIQISAP
jgi:hypothetical protein